MSESRGRDVCVFRENIHRVILKCSWITKAMNVKKKIKTQITLFYSFFEGS